jgi:hypothetical protein
METPPIIMKDSDVKSILSSIGKSNFLGKGSAGLVYRFDYYGIPAVAKIPVREDMKASIKKEIVNYGYICKIFNACLCSKNIVQMLGPTTGGLCWAKMI